MDFGAVVLLETSLEANLFICPKPLESEYNSLGIPIFRGEIMLFNDSFRFRVNQVVFSLLIMVMTVILISTTATISSAEEYQPLDHSAEIQWIKMMSQPSHTAPNPRPDLRQAAKDTDWQAMIDAVWGPGRTAAEQTSIFQNFITTMDHEYALFRNRDVDLVGLAEPYLSEIQAGVSKGRFQAIMSKMCVALQNGHTSFLNLDVVQTAPEPGCLC